MWIFRSSAAATAAGRRPTPVFPRSGPLTTPRSRHVAARRTGSRRAAPCTGRLPSRPSRRVPPPVLYRRFRRALARAPYRLSRRVLYRRFRRAPPVPYRLSRHVSPRRDRATRARRRQCPPHRRRPGKHRDRPSPRPGSQARPPPPNTSPRPRLRQHQRRPRLPPQRRGAAGPYRRMRRLVPTSARGPAHRPGSNRRDRTRRPLTRAPCARTHPDRPPRTPLSSHRRRTPARTSRHPG